jgi:hypothetical protein
MRAMFSIVGLLVVLATVGFLVKKQLGSQLASQPAAGVPAAPGSATPQEQSRQVQQQVKQSVDSMMQQPRPLPDDK